MDPHGQPASGGSDSGHGTPRQRPSVWRSLNPLRLFRRSPDAVTDAPKQRKVRRRKQKGRNNPLASLSTGLLHAPTSSVEATSPTEEIDATLHGSSKTILGLTRAGYWPLHLNPQATSTSAPSAAHAQAAKPQVLLASGSRIWGSNSWMDARNLLGIKVYDFAVYGCPTALQQAQATDQIKPGATPMLEQVLQAQLPVSLVLRASRDIPLDLLQKEMAGVLQRRMAKAQGDPQSPDLQRLLSCFTERTLPEGLRRGPAHVRQGASMLFSRNAQGELLCAAFPAPYSMLLHVPGADESSSPWLPHVSAAAKAGVVPGEHVPQEASRWQRWALGNTATQSSRAHGHAAPLVPEPLTDVALSRALLDLYLGDNPVSKKAKATASASLEHLAAAKTLRASQLPVVQQAGQASLRCPEGATDLSACVLQLR